MTAGRLVTPLAGILGITLVLGQFLSVSVPQAEAARSSPIGEAPTAQPQHSSSIVSANSVAEALDTSAVVPAASSVRDSASSSTFSTGRTAPSEYSASAKFQLAQFSSEFEAGGLGGQARAGLEGDAPAPTQTVAVDVQPPTPAAVTKRAAAKIARLPSRVVPLKKYRISAVFRQPGPHTGGVHSGLDFAAPEGRRIVSICPGRVVEAKWLGNAGQAVVVRMKDGKHVLYGHLSRITTRKGARVKPGDELGRVGSTGNSTGPHLHLQVTRPDGKSIDPLKTLQMRLGEVKRRGRR